MVSVTDALRFTIQYSDGGDGWIMAQVEQVPGAIGQGRTREEARENVTDALRLMLKPEPGESIDPDREPLELPLVSSSGGVLARQSRQHGPDATDDRPGQTQVDGASAQSTRSPLLIV